MGTGARHSRLLGCEGAGIRAFGNLGLGARLRICRAAEMDAGLPVCLAVGLPGRRAGEA